MPPDIEYEYIRSEISDIPIDIHTIKVVPRSTSSIIDLIRPVQPMSYEELQESIRKRREKIIKRENKIKNFVSRNNNRITII